MDTRVMYMLLRHDLMSSLGWPLGAVFTQIAHASTACIWTYRDDPDVIAYMADMDHMHKVTLRVDSELQLKDEAQKLAESNIDHKVWIEDDMAVCIAVKPQPRSILKPLLKHLPLYK